jgi:hypothetical protein
MLLKMLVTVRNKNGDIIGSFDQDDDQNADQSDRHKDKIIYLSHDKFVYGIWLFGFGNAGVPYLEGIYRNGVISKLMAMGYSKRYRDNGTYIFIREKENIIWEIETSVIKDDFFTTAFDALDFHCGIYHIRLSSDYLREEYLNAHKIVFDKQFLEHLSNHEKPVFRDNKDAAYFYFRNQIVKVNKDGLQYRHYRELKNQCIWRDQIIQKDFQYQPVYTDCHFARFIRNVANGEEDRLAAFTTAIGYLLHNYSHPSKGQAVIAYDEEITDLTNPMGGTGKGLLANAIRQMRNVVKIDGKKFDPHDRFRYQDITESTQVVWLDDVKPDIGFDTFHSVLTDGWSIEKKFKQQFYIRPEDSPKLFICSNSILNGDGTTNKRRQHIIEFSNHYSKQIKAGNEEPIKNEHGCIFFEDCDWNLQEWNMFFSFMLDSVGYYLQHGLMVYSYRGVNKNKLIQGTSEDFYTWVYEQGFVVDKQYNTRVRFKSFRDKYYGENSEFKQRGFTNWLKKYAEINNWKLEATTSNSIQFFTFKAI